MKKKKGGVCQDIDNFHGRMHAAKQTGMGANNEGSAVRAAMQQKSKKKKKKKQKKKKVKRSI
jgi:tRNA U54 and U55 pseudouridine synthase Pus10